MGSYFTHPFSQKHSMTSQSKITKLRYSLCQMQGWRTNMQDAAICECDLGDNNALFAVFDGHGGPQVSKFVQKIFITNLKSSKFYIERQYKEALDETFRKIDEIICSKQGQQQLKLLQINIDNPSVAQEKISYKTGCTANVVLITPQNIFIANAGDSRSVLCKMAKSLPLSIDHKPENPNELQRITQAGGSVEDGRIQGELNVSRGFGDFCFKSNKQKSYDKQMVSCKPEIVQLDRCYQDQFLIIGCDGIWQKYGNDSQPIITYIYNQQISMQNSLTVLQNLLDLLLAKSKNQGTGCDNMTIIMVQFLNAKKKMQFIH